MKQNPQGLTFEQWQWERLCDLIERQEASFPKIEHIRQRQAKELKVWDLGLEQHCPMDCAHTHEIRIQSLIAAGFESATVCNLGPTWVKTNQCSKLVLIEMRGHKWTLLQEPLRNKEGEPIRRKKAVWDWTSRTIKEISSGDQFEWRRESDPLQWVQSAPIEELSKTIISTQEFALIELPNQQMVRFGSFRKKSGGFELVQSKMNDSAVWEMSLVYFLDKENHVTHSEGQDSLPCMLYWNHQEPYEWSSTLSDWLRTQTSQWGEEHNTQNRSMRHEHTQEQRAKGLWLKAQLDKNETAEENNVVRTPRKKKL